MTEIDVARGVTEQMTAVQAARTAEEAVRQAVHSADPATGLGGATAAEVYTVLGAIGYAVELMPELLTGLSTWLRSRSGDLRVEEGAPAEDRVRAAQQALTQAAAALGEARARIAAGQAELAPVSGPVRPA